MQGITLVFFRLVLLTNSEIKSKYLHIFIINVCCFKYFFQFMLSMRIDLESLSYYMT